MSQHWSRFWRQGYITSFAEEFTDNYTGTIKAYWTGVVQELASKTGPLCAVDLGTGNGAIGQLLLETASKSSLDLTVHGVDAATISAEPVEGLTLHQGVVMEDLPLPSDSVDLVVSQYGFEYSNTEKTLHEIARVFRKGGLLRLICHSDDSVIVRQSSAQLSQYRDLTSETGFFTHLKQMIQAMGNVRSDKDLRRLARNAKAERARTALNLETGRLMEQYPDSIVVAEALKQSQVFFQEMRFSPPVKKKKYLKRLNIEYKDAAIRVQEQVASALDREQITSLKRLAESLGFIEMESNSLTDADSNKILGVEIRAIIGK